MKAVLARPLTLAAGFAVAAVLLISPGIAAAQVAPELSAGISASQADLDWGTVPGGTDGAAQPWKFLQCAWKWLGIGVPNDLLPQVVMIACGKYL